MNMDISTCSTDDDVFEYMVNHGNSWILHESIMVSSYSSSQENIREIIKIEEMLPISDNDQSSIGNTEDSKDVYTLYGEECTTYVSEGSTKFPSKTHPMLHEKLHKTEKQYECDKCGKQFTTKSYLKQHQFIHTGEKAFKCDECGKQFTVCASLKRHKLIHTGEKDNFHD